MTYSIQKISALATYPVRHDVLRFGKPIESCQFLGDDLETTHHFGYYSNDKLIGVISLFENQNPDCTNGNAIQIRGMAVLFAYQNQGVGEALIRATEKFCIEQKKERIWFNARTSAVGFYQKMGYEILGPEFEIYEVGPHFLMYKKL